jgi:hypothetical protein
MSESTTLSSPPIEPPAPDAPSAPPLDIAALRHRTEPSRFALAAMASGAVLSVTSFLTLVISGPLAALAVAAGLGVFVASIWAIVQLTRVRLLGAGVQVSSRSLPELQDAIDFVRARLDYTKRVDVYVVAKQDRPLMLTSAFGTRILVLEGDAVADLTQRDGQPELKFLLATAYGALKAKQDRWTVVLLVLEALDLLKFISPLLTPWFRATVFTGDQIGYACCSDLDVSLSIVHRSLAGKEIGTQIHADGLVEQGVRVRRSRILRLTQLFAPVPHPTNRYLNLLAFAQATSRESGQQFRNALDESGRRAHDAGVAVFPVRAPSDRAARAGLATAICMVLASVVAGLVLAGSLGPPSSEADPAAAPLDDGSSSPAAGDATPSTAPGGDAQQSTAPTSPKPTSDDIVAAVLAKIPSDVSGCQQSDAADVPHVICTDAGPDVAFVIYQPFDSTGATATAFADVTSSISQDGSCESTWTLDDTDRGSITCGTDEDDDPVVVWTIDDKAILVTAQGIASEGHDVAGIRAWWKATNWFDLGT